MPRATAVGGQGVNSFTFSLSPTISGENRLTYMGISGPSSNEPTKIDFGVGNTKY